MRKFFAVAMGSVVALVGFAGAAGASATVDLIWIDTTVTACIDDGRRDCPQLGATISSVAVTDNITLAVILTAGPNGSMGAGVSVNYDDALSLLSVVGFQSLTTTLSGPFAWLPLHSGNGVIQKLRNSVKQLRPVDGLGRVSVTTYFPTFLFVTGHGVGR